MEDQVMLLGNLGIPTVAISIVFGSPECFLSTVTWRGVLENPSFKEILVGFATHEAHCITQW